MLGADVVVPQRDRLPQRELQHLLGLAARTGGDPALRPLDRSRGRCGATPRARSMPIAGQRRRVLVAETVDVRRRRRSSSSRSRSDGSTLVGQHPDGQVVGVPRAAPANRCSGRTWLARCLGRELTALLDRSRARLVNRSNIAGSLSPCRYFLCTACRLTSSASPISCQDQPLARGRGVPGCAPAPPAAAAGRGRHAGRPGGPTRLRRWRGLTRWSWCQCRLTVEPVVNLVDRPDIPGVMFGQSLTFSGDASP